MGKVLEIPGQNDWRKQPEKKPAKKSRTNLADAFMVIWHRIGAPIEPVREFRFHELRKWRFDVAWPRHKVAVELEGGVWTGGGHTRGKIFNANCDKYNAAAALGWVVLRFTTDHLHKNPVGVVDLVSNMLKRNGATP